MIRTLDELNELEKLSLIPMSYSRLNTFDDMCQAMYYYQYIQKEEEEFAKFAVLGNIIHSVLEEEVEFNKVITKDDLTGFEEQYWAQRESWDGEHQIPDDLIDAGHQMIVNFIDRHDGDSFAVLEKEKAFEVVIGKAHLRGFIDLVELRGDTIYITDYKSGKKEVSFKGAKDNLQLGIYAAAMQHEYPDKEIYAQLYYLRSGRQKGHLFTRDDLDAVESRVIDLTNQIIETSDFKMTDNFRICSFCSFAKTKVCPKGRYRN